MEIDEIYFETLKSTNGWAKENASIFPLDRITAVIADEQTEGRGRFGKKWHSPKGKNIYVTFAFFLELSQQDPFSLTHMLAITLAHLLKEKGVIAKIKWPNDLLVEGKKISGILCETLPMHSKFCVILGLGLNVNATEQDLADVGQKATSIFIETGKKSDLRDTLEQVKHAFAKNLDLFISQGFTPFLADYQSLKM